MGVAGRIKELWETLQVSHRGAYSLERLCAFNEYTQRHSILRVLAVCGITIIPPIVLALFVDSIPLQDPNLGWKANWTVWIQVLIRSFCMSFGVALELHVTAPAASLTIATCALIALGTAIGTTILTLLVASLVVFPIPFMFFSTGGIFHVCFLLSTAAVVEHSKLNQNDEIKVQIKRFSNIMMVQLPMVVIYPAFNVLYVRVDNTSRMGLILVLPIVKFALKNIIAHVATDLEDYVPTIILSIDFFNTIYQSKCLQGSGSHITTAGVLLIDMIQNCISFRRLHLHVRDVLELQSKLSYLNSSTDANLLTSVLKACEHPELLHESYLANIQLQSCAINQFPHRQKALLATLRTRQLSVQPTMPASQSNPPDSKALISINAPRPTESCFLAPFRALMRLTSKNKIGVCPDEITALPDLTADNSIPDTYQISKQKTLLLKKTLQLLRRTEMMLLVEYVECAIPVLYGTYLSILFYLPNSKYYPELNGRSASDVHASVARIMIYAIFELLTLLWVHFILKHRFNFSALHQLAFALEQDRNVVQGSFLCWTLLIFQFTMVHNGKFCTFGIIWCKQH